MENNKKEAIITAAKKLFYEYGYDETSMDMIAAEASTQKQAISYYFNSKDNLALEVWYQIVDTNSTNLSEKIKHELKITDERLIYSVHTLYTPYFYKQDDKAFRFLNEILFKELLNTDGERLTRRNLNYNRMKMFFSDGTTNPMKLFMEYLSMCYASKGALLNYCKDRIFISSSGFAEYYFKLRLSPFIKDNEALDKLYCDVRDIVDKLNVKIKPYFILE